MDTEAMHPLQFKSGQQCLILLLQRLFDQVLKADLAGVLMLVVGVVHGIRQAFG